LGNKDIQGELTCSGTSCTNPTIVSPSLGKCINNNCIQFAGTSTTGSEISFPEIASLEIMDKIT